MDFVNAIILFFKEIDLSLFQFINHTMAHPWLDWFLPRLADFGMLRQPLLFAALVLLWRGNTRARCWLLCLAFMVFAGDSLICGPLKKMTERPRPHESIEGVRRVLVNEVKFEPMTPASKGRSFPSSHVWNMTVVAIVTINFFGAGWRWIWILPALMALSRIYTGSHFPSDTLFSLVFAPLYAHLVFRLLDLAWKRWGAQVFPQLPTLYHA